MSVLYKLKLVRRDNPDYVWANVAELKAWVRANNSYDNDPSTSVNLRDALAEYTESLEWSVEGGDGIITVQLANATKKVERDARRIELLTAAGYYDTDSGCQTLPYFYVPVSGPTPV